MPLGRRLLRTQLSRNTFHYIMFSAALLCLVMFSYLNIFALPLATTGVSAAIEYSTDVSGIEVSILGEIREATAQGFVLKDINSEETMEAVWMGDSSLPVNGTMVIASGKILSSPSSPVLLCEAVEPESKSGIIYDSPWTLPIIRMFAVSVAWFFITVSLAGIFSLSFMLKQNIVIGNRMRALTDISILAGIISIGLLIFLSITEREIVAPLGITLYAISFSILLLLISVMIRTMRESEVSELADSIPIVAWISILVGIPLTLILVETLYVDFIAEVLMEQLLPFPITLVLGLTGTVLLGLYLGGRKYDIIGARTVISFIKREVNRY